MRIHTVRWLRPGLVGLFDAAQRAGAGDAAELGADLLDRPDAAQLLEDRLVESARIVPLCMKVRTQIVRLGIAGSAPRLGGSVEIARAHWQE